MKRILLIEDDVSLSRNIIELFAEQGWIIAHVNNGNAAIKELHENTFDCVVMDVNLPGQNGFQVCKQFRVFNKNTPVILLTAFDEIDDKEEGFRSGADDYLTKPFYMRELVLRINSLLKRAENGRSSDTSITKIEAGDLSLDLVSKRAFRSKTEINLTPREFQILRSLVSAKGELVLKSNLIRDIWGGNIDANTNTVEVYINFLRNKVDKPFGKSNIKTKVGYGYFFELDDN